MNIITCTMVFKSNKEDPANPIIGIYKRKLSRFEATYILIYGRIPNYLPIQEIQDMRERVEKAERKEMINNIPIIKNLKRLWKGDICLTLKYY